MSPEKFYNFLEWIPFMGLVDGKVSLNFQRLMEILIPAILVGIITGYSSMEVIEVRLDNIDNKVINTNSRLDSLELILDKKVSRLEDKLDRMYMKYFGYDKIQPRTNQ